MNASDWAPTARPEIPEPMIVFDAVSKRYAGAAPAVDQLSLSIARGFITVFVGPSGCGKTTSLRMINRMVEPSQGRVLVAGQDVATMPAAALRRSMGYVLQGGGLFPHRTVLDNITTVLQLNGVRARTAAARGRELLETVGLDPSTGSRYPQQLSGGQQQRVGVARALAADPPVLLMDEPFSATDPVVRAELQEELLRLQQVLAKTIVFVTHDIDEATILGDRIAVFAIGGRLAQYGSAEELLRAPRNDFVASFIGRDRGFRHLSFYPPARLPIHPGPTTERIQAVDEWTVVVGPEGVPQGWCRPGRPGELLPGGSLFHEGESLRSALDAVLSSPAGLGVVVDEKGMFRGLLQPEDVLEAIEAARSKECYS